MIETVEQLLQIAPENKLVFSGAFPKGVRATIQLKNPTNDKIAFKVDTTAPNYYEARPESGIIVPGGTTQVTVMLGYTERIPVFAESHKFLVQSCVVSTYDLIQLGSAEDIINSKENASTTLTFAFSENPVVEPTLDQAPDSTETDSTECSSNVNFLCRQVEEMKENEIKRNAEIEELRKLTEELEVKNTILEIKLKKISELLKEPL